MQHLVRKSPIRRAVFNPRNSKCGSAPIADLSAHWWWTDNSDAASIYIHACRWSDRTYHRVWPRPIPGYTCNRLEMKNRMKGAKLFWLYDANGVLTSSQPPGGEGVNAEAHGRRSRTVQPLVGSSGGGQ